MNYGIPYLRICMLGSLGRFVLAEAVVIPFGMNLWKKESEKALYLKITP